MAQSLGLPVLAPKALIAARECKVLSDMESRSRNERRAARVHRDQLKKVESKKSKEGERNGSLPSALCARSPADRSRNGSKLRPFRAVARNDYSRVFRRPSLRYGLGRPRAPQGAGPLFSPGCDDRADGSEPASGQKCKNQQKVMNDQAQIPEKRQQLRRMSLKMTESVERVFDTNDMAQWVIRIINDVYRNQEPKIHQSQLWTMDPIEKTISSIILVEPNDDLEDCFGTRVGHQGRFDKGGRKRTLEDAIDCICFVIDDGTQRSIWMKSCRSTIR
jgi:hypothetical protein